MSEAKVKAAVRTRDGLKCVRCGMTNDQHRRQYGGSLDVHRTNPGSEYSTEDGVCETLCKPCHNKEPKSPRGHLLVKAATFPHPLYAPAKIDVDVYLVARAAAAINGQRVYDWLSDLANIEGSKAISKPPLKRKPPPPHPKHPRK